MVWLQEDQLGQAEHTQKILASPIPSKAPCFPLSDSTGGDLALITCLIFHPGTETKVMKMRAQQRSLAFHLPGVRKKGLVWGEGSQEYASPYRSPQGRQLARAMRRHRRRPTWRVYGSARRRDTLMTAAGRHFSSSGRRKAADKTICRD